MTTSGGDWPPSRGPNCCQQLCNARHLGTWGVISKCRKHPPPPSPMIFILWCSTFTMTSNGWGQNFPIFFHWSNHFIFFYTYEWKCTDSREQSILFCRSFRKECQTSCILTHTQEDWWSLSAFKSCGMLFKKSLGSLKHPILSSAFILKKF